MFCTEQACNDPRASKPNAITLGSQSQSAAVSTRSSINPQMDAIDFGF